MFPLLDSLFNDPLGFLQDTLYRVPAVLIALIFHEWAHGYVAYRLGDPTAKLMGRLSLNPLRHLDPVGTLMMFFLGFGWAKPVPVNPNNFGHGHRDDFFVSIAGITMNLILYLLFITGYFILFQNYGALTGEFWYAVREPLLRILAQVAIVNLSIAVFNLIPVPPLDGSHIFNDLIFKGNLFASRRTAQTGMAVIMLLSFTGWLGKGLSYVTNAVLDGTFWVLARVFGG